MKRWITRFARGAKCGFLGASGLSATPVPASAPPPAIRPAAMRAPPCRRRCRNRKKMAASDANRAQRISIHRLTLRDGLIQVQNRPRQNVHGRDVDRPLAPATGNLGGIQLFLHQPFPLILVKMNQHG